MLFCYSALDYIDELLTLLTKHEEVQISENITEEAENVKVKSYFALLIKSSSDLFRKNLIIVFMVI